MLVNMIQYDFPFSVIFLQKTLSCCVPVYNMNQISIPIISTDLPTQTDTLLWIAYKKYRLYPLYAPAPFRKYHYYIITADMVLQ